MPNDKWSTRPRRAAVATAGNLSISQSILSHLREGLDDPETGSRRRLVDCETMFQAAQFVGRAIRHVHAIDGDALERAGGGNEHMRQIAGIGLFQRERSGSAKAPVAADRYDFEAIVQRQIEPVQAIKRIGDLRRRVGAWLDRLGKMLAPYGDPIRAQQRARKFSSWFAEEGD